MIPEPKTETDLGPDDEWSEDDGVTETTLGIVTPTMVIVIPRGIVGIFSRHEEIAIRHITAVRAQTWRAGIAGIVLVVVAVAALARAASAGVVAVAVLLLFLGAVTLWGIPSVIISTSDGRSRRALGNLLDADEANRFASAVHEEIFREDWTNVQHPPRRQSIKPAKHQKAS